MDRSLSIRRQGPNPKLTSPLLLQYHQRGTVVLSANANAIKADPPTEVAYPDWKIRYENNVDFRAWKIRHVDNVDVAANPEIANFGAGCTETMANLLKEPSLNISDESWSQYHFFSKSFSGRDDAHVYLMKLDGSVASIYASTEAKCLIVSNSNKWVEMKSPGITPPRLYNSELMYQAWRDQCRASSASMKDLKYVIRGPIIEDEDEDGPLCEGTIEGTIEAINYTLKQRGEYSDEQISKGGIKTTIERDDTNPTCFKILVGTELGKPVARMCTDHSASLGEKQIHRIHVWKASPVVYMLGFELE